jgi:hypothetical protein
VNRREFFKRLGLVAVSAPAVVKAVAAPSPLKGVLDSIYQIKMERDLTAPGGDVIDIFTDKHTAHRMMEAFREYYEERYGKLDPLEPRRPKGKKARPARKGRLPGMALPDVHRGPHPWRSSRGVLHDLQEEGL